MTKNNCMVFETLGKVSDLQIQEGQNKAEGMRLSGVFGVCGVKNSNNRIYDKANYAQMVEALQQTIKTEGCPGELEHPNSMNINLENVSHKIESIQMNEDGTITGTILLLNTPKGQIAQAIVEGGLPLYISSRGAGSITNEGRVTLSTIKTYDLVGTPGFSQAKLNLAENQKVESLCESLDEGNIAWAIINEEDNNLLGDDSSEEKSEEKPNNESDKKSDDKSEEKSEEKPEEKPEEKDNKDNENKVTMNELKEAIDKLSDKVTSLEAQLHIAKESLNNLKPVNYDAVEKWVSEEFAPHFEDMFTTKIQKSIENSIVEKLNENIDASVEEVSSELKTWVVEEFAPEVQNWLTEEYAPEVQNWITEEFAPEVQKWVVEEFAPEVQNWITEEYSPEIQNWLTEEYAPVIEGWLNDEYAPVFENKINENVSQYLNEHKADRLDEIDSLLETLSNDENADVKKIVEEEKDATKYSGIYVVENMPNEYKPSWNMLDEARKDEIVRSSKMYDFTKTGVLESFWSSVEFDKKEEKQIVENKDVVSNYHNNIFAQMMRLRANVK